jgi:drug/metabolite transporter (DMT)-like permease
MLVSVGFAVTLLGEEITLLMGIGSALVLVGPGLAASRPKSKATVPAGGRVATATARFDVLPRSQLIEGYAWAAGNALAFGTSPVLIREALGDSGLGILGAAVAYTTAGLLLLISLAIPGQIAGLRQTGTTARRWFILGALTIVFAQMFRFLALSNAPVSVVVPLLRGGVIVTLVLSFIFNRDLESFDRRVLAGIVVSLIGSLALVVEV